MSKIIITMNNNQKFECEGGLPEVGKILVLCNNNFGKLFKLPHDLFGDVIVNQSQIQTIVITDKTETTGESNEKKKPGRPSTK